MGLEGATVLKRRGVRLNACLRQHFVEGGKGPTVELYHRPKRDNAFVEARERPGAFRDRIGWGGGPAFAGKASAFARSFGATRRRDKTAAASEEDWGGTEISRTR